MEMILIGRSGAVTELVAARAARRKGLSEVPPILVEQVEPVLKLPATRNSVQEGWGPFELEEEGCDSNI